MTMACIPDLDYPEKELPEACDLGNQTAAKIELSDVVIKKADDLLTQQNKLDPTFQFKTVPAMQNSTTFDVLGQAILLSAPSKR